MYFAARKSFYLTAEDFFSRMWPSNQFEFETPELNRTRWPNFFAHGPESRKILLRAANKLAKYFELLMLILSQKIGQSIVFFFTKVCPKYRKVLP